MKIRSTLLAVTGLAIAASSANAAVTFNFSSGARSAQAVFDTSGSNLVITLTNTSNADALVPTDILTAVFFNVSGGSLAFTPVSAVLNTGSSIVGKSGAVPSPATEPGNAISSEWAYKGGISGPGATAYGISSTGINIFGPPDRFNTAANLQGPTSPAGLQYGITTAGDNPSTGNGDYNGNALVKNSVVFTLSGLPSGFSLSRIADVTVLYGTSATDPFIQVPTPGSIALFGAGLVLSRRRRRD
ncbi:MAG: hypothetical protein K2Y21_08065 [Phycisphaerales bacterium]|nr:hypothetical protein [Phycisphaerales bacterium]